ncbi:MAG: nitrile hydratase subunit alpha [Rhodospirillales bacterium]|nr:MAG: nitrile hydratase subunit alpha [Rhodospirillales bacterium]
MAHDHTHDDHGHHHGHDHQHHDHDHGDGPHVHGGAEGHPHRADADDTLTYHRRLEIAVRELLVEKGVLTADEIRGAVERMDARGPHLGARVVAKAWTDPDFKARLIADGTSACVDAGITFDQSTRLIVVENTPDTHNLVVCTLCSCYPRMVLGIPPDWYKSRAYRSRAVREPREVLREFGTELPDGVAVRVHDSTADMRYLVLPRRPEGTEGWSEDKLASLVSRDSMIGVTVAATPG